MRTIEAELSALTTELKQIEIRRARRRREEREDRRRLSEVNAAIHRTKLKALEGKPNAVRLGYRVPITDRCAHLNDCPGTLTKVRRTVASVTFHVPGKPVGEKWTIPLQGLKPVEEQQSERFGAMLESVKAG